MSARKKRTAATPQETLDAIKDLLLKAKPRLDDRKPDLRTALVDDLHRIAFLAESLTEQRSRWKKSLPQADELLDREGVLLWNTSGIIGKAPDDNDGRAVVAALRLAAFRLIEAATEQKPGIESLIHVLQLASKTGTTLSELGSKDMAASVLTCAAKYEEMLRLADDIGGTHKQAKARASIIYFSSRMEAAWREGNIGLSEFMLVKITEDFGELVVILTPHDRELLASKILEIGKSGLKTSIRQSKAPAAADGVRNLDAVRWLQKAFALTEQLDDTATPSIAELKRLILRSLARAYFCSSPDDPENLARADAALQELVVSLDASNDHASDEYQQLRWMRLALVKRSKAGESALFDAFKSIIDNMTFAESTVTDILQELRTIIPHHGLVTSITLYCLRKALESSNPNGASFVDRLLLSLIIHCSRDDDHSRAMKDLDKAFNDISEADFQIPRIPATACLTMMWKYGNRDYNAKKWADAANWYLAGSHQIFQSIGPMSTSKCFRKAALCYIQQKEYATASAIIRRCPSTEATTNYIIFLAAVHRGLEDEAIQAVEEMVKAPDFDRKMLFLATQLSHECDMKTLLLSVLEALLKTMAIGDKADTLIDGMTLIRCIIRLILKLLNDKAADRPRLVTALLKHLTTARKMVETAVSQNDLSLIAKDVSWLWRAAYNCAIDGCMAWEQSESQISDLFDVSRELLELYCEGTPTAVDADLHHHVVTASFAAVTGRVFAVRRTLSECGSIDQEELRRVASAIRTSKSRITSIMTKRRSADDKVHVAPFLHILHVFDAELSSHLCEWDQLLKVIQDVNETGSSAANVFEAIADIVWAAKECPVEVSFAALEAILHASLDRNSLSVDKFSRWLRAICVMLLARNSSVDRGKAIGYIEQAITVMDTYHGEALGRGGDDDQESYPVDERQWLLATSYNMGIECLHASLLDEAKRWFEVSTTICRFVPDGQNRSQKISETYTHLLERYSRGRGSAAAT